MQAQAAAPPLLNERAEVDMRRDVLFPWQGERRFVHLVAIVTGQGAGAAIISIERAGLIPVIDDQQKASALLCARRSIQASGALPHPAYSIKIDFPCQPSPKLRQGI